MDNLSKKKVVVLGSTGSIGTQALDVIASHSDSFSVLALCAGNRTDLLMEQIQRFNPRYVSSIRKLNGSMLPDGTKYIDSADAASFLSSLEDCDIVIGGISGIAQLKPLLSALEAGKRVCLANKESIVCGHDLVNAALQKAGELIPVDSEQSAIFQCLNGGRKKDVDHVILTASGGPFWKLSPAEWKKITPEQAMQHPTWSMGKKITIDSATLFNKGLELIEACYLFDLLPESIHVIIHPQSIMHSAVAFKDGTVIANVSATDMRIPIQYAMTYPQRTVSPVQPLSIDKINGLTFFDADFNRFKALKLAFDSVKEGGSSPIVFNAANEEAVKLFVGRQIGFTDIPSIVEDVLSSVPHSIPNDLESILDVDRIARECTSKLENRYRLA